MVTQRGELVPVERAMQPPAGLNDPSASTDMATIANWIVKSGYFGNTLDVPKVGVKLLVGQELGVGPMMAIRHVHIFDGGKGPRIVLGAELMATLIKQSRDYEYTVDEHTDQICTVSVLRRGKPIGSASFSLADANKAKLANKENWQNYGRDMLFWRAIARAFRRFTPELASGTEAVSQEEVDAEPMSHEQRKKLFAWAKEQKMDEAARHQWASEVLCRHISTWSWDCAEPITRAEATALIDAAYDGVEGVAGVGAGGRAGDAQDRATQVAPPAAEAVMDREGEARRGADVRPADAGHHPSEGRRPTVPAVAATAAVEPPEQPQDDTPADELAALRRKATDEFRRTSAAAPKEWRPWWRATVEDLCPGAWEEFPKSLNGPQLRELMERFKEVQPWAQDPDTEEGI